LTRRRHTWTRPRSVHSITGSPITCGRATLHTRSPALPRGQPRGTARAPRRLSGQHLQVAQRRQQELGLCGELGHPAERAPAIHLSPAPNIISCPDGTAHARTSLPERTVPRGGRTRLSELDLKERRAVLAHVDVVERLPPPAGLSGSRGTAGRRRAGAVRDCAPGRAHWTSRGSLARRHRGSPTRPASGTPGGVARPPCRGTPCGCPAALYTEPPERERTFTDSSDYETIYILEYSSCTNIICY